MECKNNCGAKAAPNTNFCSQQCCDEWAANLLVGGILKAVYGGRTDAKSRNN